MVEIATEDGTVLGTFQSTKEFAALVVSSPDLEAGGKNVVTVDGTTAGTASAA